MQPRSAEPDAAPVSARSLLDGRHVEVARVYEHEVKGAEGGQWQRVEYGWDYDAAVAYELITDLHGKELSFRQIPGQILRANEREQARANALVREHPLLAADAATPNAEFEGGFILMEPDHQHCHLQSRCVYVLVSTDTGRNKIIQAIVDLQSGQVVETHFDPEMLGSHQ